MDRLWAPWRAQYIRENADSLGSDGGCFLCRARDGTDDRDTLLAWRRPRSMVVLNRFPYNSGHLLIAPNTHAGTLEAFVGDDLTEPLDTIKRVVTILDRMLRPQGYNIGLNLGKSAGAGLPGHLHWHVVPRWDGDSNFMPIVGHTKVIVESLSEFYDRFVAEVSRDGSENR
jgi:ATP adenylyltransferase